MIVSCGLFKNSPAFIMSYFMVSKDSGKKRVLKSKEIDQMSSIFFFLNKKDPTVFVLYNFSVSLIVSSACKVGERGPPCILDLRRAYSLAG